MEIEYVNKRPFVPYVITFLGKQLHAQCKITVHTNITAMWHIHKKLIITDLC